MAKAIESIVEQATGRCGRAQLIAAVLVLATAVVHVTSVSSYVRLRRELDELEDRRAALDQAGRGVRELRERIDTFDAATRQRAEGLLSDALADLAALREAFC